MSSPNIEASGVTRTVRAADIPLLSPALDKMTPEHLRKMTPMPKGISGGTLAAIVAGVAVAGGALYLMTRKKEAPRAAIGRWTGHIQEGRSGLQSAPGFDR